MSDDHKDGHHPTQVNGWNRWSKLVLDKLSTAELERKEFRKELQQFKLDMLSQHADLKSDIKLLKFQASMWGASVALIVSTAVSMIIRG